MAIGDKKPVVMQSDRAVPSGIATLGTDGKLLDTQIPSLEKLGAAPAPLSKHKTLYVATTGSDTTGDGTEANPYKTIQKAVNTLPKDLGTYRTTIHVAAGTYPDEVRIQGFSGGYSNSPGVKIEGESKDAVLIEGGIMVSACSAYIDLTNLHVTGNNSGANITALENRRVRVSSCILDGTSASLGIWSSGTNHFGISSVTISDKTKYAVWVSAGTLEAIYLNGENNAVGVIAGNSNGGASGLALCNNITLTADTLFAKERGGVIFNNGALV